MGCESSGLGFFLHVPESLSMNFILLRICSRSPLGRAENLDPLFFKESDDSSWFRCLVFCGAEKGGVSSSFQLPDHARSFVWPLRYTWAERGVQRHCEPVVLFLLLMIRAGHQQTSLSDEDESSVLFLWGFQRSMTNAWSRRETMLKMKIAGKEPGRRSVTRMLNRLPQNRNLPPSR